MREDNLPEVVESQKVQILTSVWIIPIIALIVALWLAWQYFSQLGPKVEVIFDSGSGLKVGESQVKMRDVPIGVVKSIKLLEGKKGVLVTLRLNNDARKFLNKDTKFWIARPQINTKGVSGLDTIMSGPYVAMYGKIGGSIKKRFKGLEEPYIDKDEIHGKRFHLIAPNSRDLRVGANIYYKKLNAGTIESIKLSPDGKRVNFTVFIKEPFSKFVTSSTIFWRINNFSVDFSANTLKVNVAPLANLLNGGIAFKTAQQSLRDIKIDDNYTFALYDDYAEARKKVIGFGGASYKTFEFEFDEEIGNLDIGAPINFYGFEIGHVVNIESDFDSNKTKIRSVIIGTIDLSVFIDFKKGVSPEENLQKAVQKGLKARLAISNPITKTQYIELAFDKKDKAGKIFPTNKYAIFPTMHSQFDGIVDKVAQFIDKLNSLKLNSLVNSINTLVDKSSPKVVDLLVKLNRSVNNINKITSNKNIKNLPKRVDLLLKDTTKTLKEINLLLSGDNTHSVLSAEITTMLKELTDMSRSVRRLSNKLDKKPNALIFGDK